MGALTDLRDWLLARFRRQPDQLFARITVLIVLIAFTGLYVAPSVAILFPAQTAVNTDIPVLRNDQPVPTSHGSGCGSYWETVRFRGGIGPTIQLQAGFCWTGKRVRWIWGLQQSNCYPLNAASTEVHMTCQITGGGRNSLNVTYTADISSSFLPFARRRVQMQISVAPQGYVLEYPTSD